MSGEVRFRISSLLHTIVCFFVISIMLIGFMLPVLVNAQGDDGLVYVVEVKDTVEKGLLAYMERAFREAEEAQADHIILQIHTPGGAVDAASSIGDLIFYSSIPVTAFINTEATSAGAFIALNADQIVMAPTGTIGSAQVVNLEGGAADEKAQSYWKGRMAAAAEEAAGRDPIYALAMVDPSIEIEGLVKEGQLLNFRSSEALQYGYAEAIASDLDEVLQFLGLPDAQVVQVDISWAERLARFITHPIVASILLSLASLGLILELYSPGFGLPGILGLSGLVLFFFGHLVAGFAGWEAMLLFVVGLVLLVIELFIPGFGIFGILGIIGVLSGLVLASEDVWAGLRHIAIALFFSLVAIIILSRFLQTRGVWSRLVLAEGLSVEETEALQTEKATLIGQKGITVTALRPSGVIRIDGKRHDVVSEGEWIGAGIEVEVIKVEGPRIVVRQIEENKS